MTEFESGFYRLYKYVPKAGNHLGDLTLVSVGLWDAGGYYDPKKEGSPAEQVVAWVKDAAKFHQNDFFLEPGTYFVIPEHFTQGGQQTSFYVKEQEIDYAK